MRDIVYILGIFIISLSGCADQKNTHTLIEKAGKDNFLIVPKIGVNNPNKPVDKIRKKRKARKVEKTKKIEKHPKKENSCVLKNSQLDQESMNFSTSEIWMH